MGKQQRAAATTEQLRVRLELRRSAASAKHVNAARAGAPRQRSRGSARRAAILDVS